MRTSSRESTDKETERNVKVIHAPTVCSRSSLLEVPPTSFDPFCPRERDSLLSEETTICSVSV